MNSITGKYSKRNVLLKGAFSLTLFPKAPVINLGSIEDDWSAVGSDIRRAMNAQEACD
jgi:hypothetical protein